MEQTQHTEHFSKLPPQAVDVEEAVIGALMLESGAFGMVADILKPEHFYKDANKLIYSAITTLYGKSEPIDILTVTDQLKKTNTLDLIGGTYHILELTDKVHSAANIEQHARIILEKSIKRSLIEAGSTLQQKGYDDTVDVFELMEVAEKTIIGIHQESHKKQVEHVSSVSDRYFKDIAHKAQQKQDITGVPCGILSIDQVTHGWQDGDLIIIAARPGMGKAQPFWSKVVTENGYKMMGDVQVGDIVFNRLGKKTKVVGVFDQGKKPIYKITFSDNTFTHSCDEHLWFVQSRQDRRVGLPGSVMELSQIKKQLRVGSDNRLNYCVPYCDPVEFDKKYLPVKPYLLGVLIGDGCLNKRSIVISNPEADIVERCSELIPDGEVLVKSTKIDYRLIKRKLGPYLSETAIQLQSLGLYSSVSDEKFIPHPYLHSCVEDRIDLLRGLLDTDGFVTKGQSNIEFSTVSRRLKDDITYLVASLGGNANFKKLSGNYLKNGVRTHTKDYYRINIALPSDILPFNSNKNISKFKPRERPFNKFIESIRYEGDHDCRCIMVDSDDHLYLTDDFIVTHNTALSLTFARNTAVNFKKGVAIFSLEMTSEQLFNRLLSIESEIDSSRIKHGKIQGHEWTALSNAKDKLDSAPIFIDDTPALSILELRAKAMRLKAKEGIGLIIVDYAQLMTSGEKSVKNRDLELGIISRGLKALAKDLRVPVITLCQLSRAVETRADKRPQLSDLRESGNFENDADIVAFLYRPEYYNILQDDAGNSLVGVAQFEIAKHRHGALHRKNIRFVDKLTKFMDLASPSIPPPVTQTNMFKNDVPY